MGIRQVGAKTGKVLAKEYGTMDALRGASVEELPLVQDVGEITAASIAGWFAQAQSQRMIEKLRNAGVNMQCDIEVADNRFAGKIFVLTGALT